VCVCDATECARFVVLLLCGVCVCVRVHACVCVCVYAQEVRKGDQPGGEGGGGEGGPRRGGGGGKMPSEQRAGRFRVEVSGLKV
jgi:hypothetical protein